METQLADLLDTIREEGLEKTRQKTDALLTEAKDKARSIVEGAEKKAAQIMKQARNEHQKLIEGGIVSLQHATRDSILLLEKEVIRVFNNILAQQVTKSLSTGELATSIQKIIMQVGKSMDEIHLHVSEKDLAVVESTLQKEMNQKLQKKLHIIMDKQLDAGFQIWQKGDNIHLDFSQSAIIAFLIKQLHPRLQKIMRKS